ncbi:M50 family metallopeptidase [Paludibaculum fermentans]|uniref:M50 family metallopeptidase n=1 Tax=Paludibaculum fermentans TaxID=1473598 RepID=A0A7S7NS10_PALFE|nr:M50 family metallopeptidase [Paludibaculum fermentans]QOY88693.1 M50 family metallopeptidase [Paludibaculum fermentans]
MAWWQMKRGRKFAGRWAIAASIAHFLILPIGPVVTIAGLVVFMRRKQREALHVERPPEHTPKAGDGTSRFTQAAVYIVPWILAFAGFRWVGRLAAQLGLTAIQGPLTGLIVLPLAILLSIFFHESGHAIGAWASDFQVRMFRVGPFSVSKLEGRWRFEWAGLLGGATGALPTRPRGIRSGALFTIAAGPAASFASGTICLVLFLTARNAPWQPAWDLLGTLTVLCLIDSVVNLLPIGTEHGGYSDGARLWQLALNGPWSRRIVFQFYTGLSITGDLSPQDWPSDLVEDSARVEDGSSGDPGAILFALVHFRFRGEIERAEEYFNLIHQHAKHWPEKTVTQFAPEFSFYQAIYRGDAEAAQLWFDRFKDKSLSDYWRAKAALHGAKGELEDGRAAWYKGWSLVLQAPPRGIRLLDEHDFRLMAERWWPDLVSLVPVHSTAAQQPVIRREAVPA